ncbi:MAG: lysine 5,6-aminomutase reactivase ATPase KamC [Vulcanimicrobiaceae bacterium]
MRFDGLLDATTRGALQLHWLRAELEPVSEYGRRAFETLEPFAPGQEDAARERIRLTLALAHALDGGRIDAIRDALRTAPDATPAIARASMGDVLADANFLELQRMLDAATRIDALLADSHAPLRVPGTEVAAVISALERGRRGKFGFYLTDEYDAGLRDARAAAERAQAEYDAVRGRLAQRIAKQLGRDDIAAGEFIVMRDELRGAMPPEVHVVREAPTYLLCELELDEAALAALTRRDAANDAVAAAEEAARTHISELIRAHAHALERLAVGLGTIDVALAQARFTQRFDCVAPEIAAEPLVTYRDGRFLPLAVELEREGRAYEPISLDLDGVAILTGPNMGGKSVALRTTAFVAVLCAFGIPVPARSARAGLFDEIAWLGIGTDEEPGGLLSSFAKEVVRLRELLARRASRLLVLIDEFARTTTPHEGKALLVALVRTLRERERVAFIATHLAGIARASGARHFAVRGLRDVPRTPPSGDLGQALAALAASMDYAIVEVTGDGERQADAIALAQLLGLDAALIAEARAALDVEGS